MPSARLPLVLCPWVLFAGGCAARMPAGEETAGSTGLADGAAPAPDDPSARPDAAPAAADGAKADRPRVDAGKPDAVYYPPVKCAPDLLFCEDFESGLLNPSRWTYNGAVYYHNEDRGVAFDVDAAQARGKHALRVRRTEPLGEEQGLDTGDGHRKTVMKLPFGSSTLFVRFFIFIDDPTPNRWFNTFFISDPAKDRMNEWLWGPKLVPTDEKNPAPSVFHWVANDATRRYTAAGRWSCWELELRGAEKRAVLYVDGNEVTFYVDGKPLDGLGSTPLDWVPDTVQLNIGYNGGHEDILKHPPDGFFDMWFDDIAVAKQRIGCGD